MSSLIVNSAIAAKDKAVEINNSERLIYIYYIINLLIYYYLHFITFNNRVVQWKQSTTESLTKAQIVATPYYTSSKANILSVVSILSYLIIYMYN